MVSLKTHWKSQFHNAPVYGILLGTLRLPVSAVACYLPNQWLSPGPGAWFNK